MSTIPLRPARGRTVPGARRAFHYAEAPAFHPAGLPSETDYVATLTVLYDGLRPAVNAARLGANLAAAASATDLFPNGGVAYIGGTQGVSDATASVQATFRSAQPVAESTLKRALARALFWSTTFTNPRGEQFGGDPSDGGSGIVRVLGGESARGISRATFSLSTTAVPASGPASSIVALPTTPPSGPAPAAVAITLPALGVRSSALTRPQIARFQQILTAAGFDTRGVDGAIGTNTRAAVTAFQRAYQRTNTSLPARTREFLGMVDPLGIDGDLGPKTQRALTWLATPTAEGGGGLAVGPAPALPAPSTRPPVTSSPATGSSTSGGAATRPPVTSSPATGGAATQASMGGGTIAVFALGAAAVGVAIAYRDKLFGGARRGGAAIARRYKAARRGSGG